MQITVIGGGPGGLYTSLLLKQSHPEWTVTLYERNPPDVTYGWGIVFPDRGLANLEEADRETHAAITSAFTEWEPFDIHYRGERFRCGGHRFASLMRTDLLEILQDRCRDVGVDLRFETEITEPTRLAAQTDLLVAADGIHSRTRAEYREAFGTEITQGEARFAWFGTDQPFDALSHIFVENDDGIWCAHTYPGRTSTFIVDCDPETWANADLASRSESGYLEYLESVFEDYLDGHAIRSQQDTWRQFSTISNETWFHDNIVLVGDAAHTAHYSIGSGTTLALEDGIGLARSFEEFDGDLESALREYEHRRLSFVEPLQQAGERSREHFEAIRRFFGVSGPQFALHHLTRSGRLTYESLRRRDPGFIDEFEQWFAANQTPVEGPDVPESPGPPGDQPLALREVTLANRFVGTGERTWSATDGQPTSLTLEGLVDRVANGYGLVLTEPLAVTAAGRPTEGSPGLYHEDHSAAWAKAIDRGRMNGDSVLGAHLVHAGPRAAQDPGVFGFGDRRPREQVWAPPLRDAFPSPPTAYEPASMSASDLDRVRTAYVEAAQRADAAGFEFLQLHAGHGSLLSVFLSPFSNGRDDDYGGSAPDRRRFLLEVTADVREAWPSHKPLGVTLQAADWVEGGIGLQEAIGTTEALAEHGVDLVAPVAGGLSGADRPGPNADVSGYSDHLRHATGVRTLATPHAIDRDRVDTLVGTGRADCCTFAGRFDT